VVPIPPEEQGRLGIATKVCACVVKRDVLANVERGWKGLTKAGVIPSSPLREHTSGNLRVTAPDPVFREHLRHVAVRMGPYWGFAVVSDVGLMDAWLSGANEVLDPDVSVRRAARPSNRHGSLADLTEPPELLIIRTGVKVARNVAMPEVLLEAILHRDHLDKPTWVVDQPGYRLGDGHISWDTHVGDALYYWKHVELEGPEKNEAAAPVPSGSGFRPMTMSGASGATSGAAPEAPKRDMLKETVTTRPSKKKGGRP